MSAHLTVASNREEYCIPASEFGDLVCRFHLEWGIDRSTGLMHPMVIHPALTHTACRPARHAEIEAYRDAYRKTHLHR